MVRLDLNPKVNEFNAKYKAATGADPSSQYVYPGYVMIDVCMARDILNSSNALSGLPTTGA